MKIDVLLGLQWGDEGKGKIVDCIAQEYACIARFQGGPNAGHTLQFEGKKFVLHTIPSGIFRQDQINLIGNGVVIDPLVLRKELALITEAGVDIGRQLCLARKAHLILPTHRLLDMASEALKGEQKIGSTLKGIGPTYMDKTGRNGLRVGDLFTPGFLKKYQALRDKHKSMLALYPQVGFDLEEEETRWMESLEALKQVSVVDGEYFINDLLAAGKRILAEGAQGSMLDVDHGTYPFVTSSNTITASVCTGLGVAPSTIGEVIGITKAYCTRVGSGPFPTELHDETGQTLRQAGHEFGSTTGRPRRCGWLDLPQLAYTIMLNGVTQLVVTKLDVLNDFPWISVATAYQVEGQETDRMPYDLNDTLPQPVYTTLKGWECGMEGIRNYPDLPLMARQYLEFIEEKLGVPIRHVSTSPDRDALLAKGPWN